MWCLKFIGRLSCIKLSKAWKIGGYFDSDRRDSLAVYLSLSISYVTGWRCNSLTPRGVFKCVIAENLWRVHFMSIYCETALRWMPLNTFDYHIKAETNGRHFADDIFKCIFLDDNVWIPIKMSLKFVPKGPINNIPEMVHIMAWRRPGDKPLSEPMLSNLLTHICVTWPQWVMIQHWFR